MNRPLIFKFLVLALLLGSAIFPQVTVAADVAAETPERLFARVVAPESGPSASLAAVAERVVTINFSAFAAAQMAIELPDGALLKASRSRLERRGANDFTWLGRVDQGGGEVVLTVKNGYLSGLVYGPAGVYQIIPQAAEVHRLVQLDHGLFPECAGAVEPPPLLVPQELLPQPKVDPLDRVEVMVLYTPQARSEAGGTAQVEAVAQNAVDITNLAYANSQITVRMYLVHTEEATRNDSGNISADLSWLSGNADVATLRNTHAADMVSLLVSNGGNACGVGYVQRSPGSGFASSAFQVTALSCAVGNLSFAHEFGHNMGCEHNPEDSSAWPANGSYPWSYGHWYSGNYRTVMSYANPCSGGCTRHPYFSNSNVMFQGQPTGILDQRENYRTINATAEYVTNFRQSNRFFSDGFESGDTGAWN